MTPSSVLTSPLRVEAFSTTSPRTKSRFRTQNLVMSVPTMEVLSTSEASLRLVFSTQILLSARAWVTEGLSLELTTRPGLLMTRGFKITQQVSVVLIYLFRILPRRSNWLIPHSLTPLESKALKVWELPSILLARASPKFTSQVKTQP